jgi:hypothetical protein
VSPGRLKKPNFELARIRGHGTHHRERPRITTSDAAGKPAPSHNQSA